MIFDVRISCFAAVIIDIISFCIQESDANVAFLHDRDITNLIEDGGFTLNRHALDNNCASLSTVEQLLLI